jgi:hypothetical protein
MSRYCTEGPSKCSLAIKKKPKSVSEKNPTNKNVSSAAILAAKNKPKSVSEKNPTKKKASLAANFITLADVKEASSTARRVHDPVLRLFIATLFNFSFFTTSSLYLTLKSLDYVLDIKKIAGNDRCKLLIDHLKKGLQVFHESETAWSPVSFLVSIFEIFSFLEQQCCMTNTDSFFLGQFGLRCNHWQ